MELTYSNQLSGFDPGKRYRNPEHFDKPEAGVTSVLVIGDWPSVVDAYEAAGIDVSVKEGAKVALVGGHGLTADQVVALRRELGAIGVMVEGFASGQLESSGEGDTAVRLFQVLEAVNAGVESLRSERDGEASKVEHLSKQNTDLLTQIETLKAGGGDTETEELKAKLTEAGVSFRANASKESLEKLAAELTKE